jgi:titin
VLTDAGTTSETSSTIEGTLTGSTEATFVVRFYSNPDGGGEGKVFRGQTTVTTNGNGNAAFSFATASAIPAGQSVTATATSADGDTSEFSAATTVD